MKKLLIFILLIVLLFYRPINYIDLKKQYRNTIEVTIDGAVKSKKSLSLPLYSPLEEIYHHIELLPSADTSMLNPKTILKDGDCIVIPEIKEIPLISINTAPLEQLITLPGIKEATATKIIDYRTQVGLFQKIEDIMLVKGIGEAKFNQIKDLITL